MGPLRVRFPDEPQPALDRFIRRYEGYGRGTTFIFPKLMSALNVPNRAAPVLASPWAWRFQLAGSVAVAGQILTEYSLVVLSGFHCTANFIMYFTPSVSCREES